MLYDYYAYDASDTQIARDGIDAVTLKLHYSNLIVSGYRVFIRDHGTEDWKSPDQFGHALYPR